MKLQDVRTIATNHHLKPGSSDKGEPIRAIQGEEANFGFFPGGLHDYPVPYDCLWHSNCLNRVTV